MKNTSIENITTTSTTASTIQTTDTTTTATLPAGYLEGGYHATTDKGAKYLRPEYVSDYAQKIAAALSTMKPSDFSGLLRELKRSKKRVLLFEARQTAAAEMLPKAMALHHRKKAPSLLVDFISVNLDAIQTDEEWTAFYRHLEAIQSFIIVQHE